MTEATETAVADIVERLRDLSSLPLIGRGYRGHAIRSGLREAATALEAEHAARVKAEGALTAADDLISFWRDYREMPSDQFHEKYRMDTTTSSLRMTELALRYREARALKGEPS